MTDEESYNIMCHFLLPVFTTDINTKINQTNQKIEQQIKSKFPPKKKLGFTITMKPTPNETTQRIESEKEKSNEKPPKNPISIEKEKEIKPSKFSKTSPSIKSERNEKVERNERYQKSQKSQKSQSVAIDDDTIEEDERNNRFGEGKTRNTTKRRRSTSRNNEKEREIDLKRRRQMKDDRIKREIEREDPRKKEIEEFKEKKYDAMMTKELKHKGDNYNSKKEYDKSLLCYCEALIGYAQMVFRKDMTFVQIKELLNFVYMISEKHKHTEIGNGVNLILSQLYLRLFSFDHSNIDQFLKDDQFWKDNIIPLCLSQLHKLKQSKN